MFANPQWFRTRVTKTRVRPVSWKGWAYVMAWGAGTAIPCLALLSRGRGVEAMIWLAAAAALWVREMRQVRRSLSATPTEDVLVIDDEGARMGRSLHTREFRMQARS